MAGNRRILLVDDDAYLRQSLSEQLAAQGFEVGEAATAAEGLARLAGEAWDAVLLDVGLPDGDGRALCAEARRRGVRVPIILLTAADGESGLDAGANDSVNKPFRLGVLLARLAAQIRQHQRGDGARFAVGPYLFQPAAKLLLDGEKRKIRLTEKETAILDYLYRAGAVVARETLLGEVWGYNAAATTHTLETHVYRLRRKIEKDPAEARLLVTEAGGYRLVP